MTKWQIPPEIKIYEALGCIADNRLEIENKSYAKIYSSSKNKYYEVKYNSDLNQIMCNDNESYYIGYLGYPAIAFLMKINVLEFNKKYSNALKKIMWKDLNVKYDRNKGIGVPNYDFDKVIEEIDNILISKEINLKKFKDYIQKILKEIKNLNLTYLGDKQTPPKGY